ncbi:endonuclease/exonuclease/phosphatase family protein [Sunxiuqinia dokdonensis]|uniref:Endonuclease/exonuclease/phosphatase domain-containing protein n=1 Tax=Sunxiuqinia dokdonensis TaxID=1409788 RepID=A0A0L8V985_9BACT|nr:endonuclease/exonuclease/phosphatase family protein [Sunxiuqinia dokdonensis]KOH45011.1 hypothetical protein NC99_21360 [Sunxiuqinia dokdonensis]
MRSLLTNILIIFLFISCNESPSIPDSAEDRTQEDENTYGLDNDSKSKLSEIKVMTYNIHAGNPPSKPGICDLNAVAEAIVQANPDIVLLQEVDKNTGRNDFRGDQSKELGKLTQMNYQFFSARIYLSGYYGVAILSKYPLLNAKKHLLAKEPALEQRVLGTAIVDLPGIDSIMVACTHLQHNDANNRLNQIQDVVQLLSPSQVPVIIGGDFNEQPSADQFFSVFDENFTRSCIGNDCPKTFSTTNPYATIDYLAFKPEAAFETTRHEIWYENYASDHFPVMATFKIKR